MNPDSNCEVARIKIGKLEKVWEAMGDSEGPVVDYLKTELEEARIGAKRRPINVEVEENGLQRWGHSTRPEHVCHGWKPSRRQSRRLSLSLCQKLFPRRSGQRRCRDHERIGAIACRSQSRQSSAGEGRQTARRSCRGSSHHPQVVEGWFSEKHTELRDVIEFGDKESILALTDLIRQGVLQCHKLPSTVGTWLREDRDTSVWLEGMSCERSQQPRAASILGTCIRRVVGCIRT